MTRNGFTRKKVESLTLGEKLKKLRSEGRISLAEVSKQTKIQAKYLEFLENGEYEKMPADVYVKGFIRSYAHYLGMDEKYFLKIYSREKGIRDNIGNKRKANRPAEPLNFSGFSITPKKIIASAIILATFGGFLYIYNELDAFISTPRLVVLSPSGGLTTEEKSIYVSGETERGADVFINNQPTRVNDSGEFSEKISLQNGMNIISVKAKNRFAKEIVREIAVQANYEVASPESTDEENKELMEAKKEREALIMEVSANPDPVWISVEVDGRLVYSGTLSPSIPQSFRAEEKISITSGRGNTTYVKLNGIDRGALSGSAGVARNVVFTAGAQ